MIRKAVLRRGIPASAPYRLGRATYLIRANPLLTYAQKPRTETEEKAYSSERAKEAVRSFQHYAARARVIDAATPRAAVSNGATPRAAHTKNKTDREAYNGCCPCGHRDGPVCLCVYIDETMRGHAAAGTPRARRFPRARAGERRRLVGRFRLLPG